MRRSSPLVAVTARSGPWRLRLALVAVIALTTGGCGTRVNEETLPVPSSVGAIQTPSVQSPAPASSPVDAIQTPSGQSTVSAASPAAPSGSNASAQSSPAAMPKSAAPSRPSVPVANSSVAPPTTDPPRTGARGLPAPPVPTRGSPIVIANIGTYSGPAGSTLRGLLAGTQIWAKAVNERGGINGHPVRLISYDDGGDPARYRAQMQEAVEKHRAIAFVGNADPFSGRSGMPYIESKRIPVIGSDGTGQWFYESQFYFPQSSSGQAFAGTAIASIADQLVPAQKTRTGCDELC